MEDPGRRHLSAKPKVENGLQQVRSLSRFKMSRIDKDLKQQQTGGRVRKACGGLDCILRAVERGLQVSNVQEHPIGKQHPTEDPARLV